MVEYTLKKFLQNSAGHASAYRVLRKNGTLPRTSRDENPYGLGFALKLYNCPRDTLQHSRSFSAHSLDVSFTSSAFFANASSYFLCRSWYSSLMKHVLHSSLFSSPISFVNKSLSTEQLNAKYNRLIIQYTISYDTQCCTYVHAGYPPSLLWKPHSSTSCQLCMLCVYSHSTRMEFFRICSVPE